MKLGLDFLHNPAFVAPFLVASLIAGFIFFALPFIKRGSKKSRHMAIIAKRRADIENETKRQIKKRAEQSKLSGKKSMSAMYQIRKLAGDLGDDVRKKLLMAGIRDPTAPIKFIIARLVLPVIFVLIAVFLITTGDFDLSSLKRVLIIIGATAFGYKFPDIIIKNQIDKRQAEINLSFPDALDLILICVQGGIGLEQSIERVSVEVAENSEILAEELGVLNAEMSLLGDRRLALQNFAARMGVGAAKTFATAVLQAEQYGSSISSALQTMAGELRDLRMAAAEEKAAGLPPKLTVPMILFFLPALFIIILGPAGIQVSHM